jgi:hypothetical protein
MKKSLTRGSALVLAGGALALTGAILPAQAATSTGWRLSATFGVRANATILTSVDAVSARDAWATGLSAPTKGDNLQTLIKHWNGKSWANVVLPAKVARAWQKTDSFEGEIGATSRSNVWILGDAGSYLRLKGTRWSVGKLPGSSETSGDVIEVTSARVFSSVNVWAFGTRLDLGTSTEPTGTPYAAHFNGHAWTVTKLPAGVTGGVITAASATSSRSIWAVTGSPSALVAVPGGGSGAAEVLHWTPAAGWTVPAQPVLPAGANLTSVLVEQNGHVLAGGSEKNSHKGATPLAATWNGTAWTVAALPSSSTAKWTLTSLAADGRGAWAVADATNRESSQVWRLSGSTWSLVKPAFGKRASVLLQLASVPHTSSAWGAGALKAGKSGALAMIAVAGPTPR